MRRQYGFSLIELMVTVVIISILSMIAVPVYTDYVRRGKIPDATSKLAMKRVQQEQFFQDNRTYVGGTGCTTDTSSSEYFNFSCLAPSLSATTYTLQAVGKSSMTGFTYTVTQDNAKTTTITGVSGWTGNSSCWVTNKGGVC